MRVLKIDTGGSFPAMIEKVKKEELKENSVKRDFEFDWSSFSNYEVYKIRRKGKDEILGLMALEDFREELRIHIKLIENAIGNRGSNKKIDRVAGCLIAFACKISFQKNYGGFVSLKPKTKLINHYSKKYGFVQMGRQQAVFFESSDFLIKKYLSDEEI